MNLVDTNKPRIYIAGPMTGKHMNNTKAFTLRETLLIQAGWDAVNPSSMDAQANVDPLNPGLYDYEAAATRDIPALRTCQAIYMMAEWENSRGACWERALAKYWGLKRYYEIPRADHESATLPKAPDIRMAIIRLKNAHTNT